MQIENQMVVVRGGGDLGTGVALRLQRVGWRVLMCELAQPLVIRRTVAFASAVYDGSIEVEGVVAQRIDRVAEADRIWAVDQVPVLIDPDWSLSRSLHPSLIVDAVMAKRNLGTRLDEAPIVIGLGPGFTVGVDCHAVIETQRGHNLGRVYYQGAAVPDTGTPGKIDGEDALRVVRAPSAGVFYGHRNIGEPVTAGNVIGRVITLDGSVTDSGAWRVATADRDSSRPLGQVLRTKIDGVLRGLLHDGLLIAAGTKVADVDPRAEPSYCFTVSDKSLAVGGGVLEATLYLARQSRISPP